MKISVKKTITILALIIGLSATLIACSGGDSGMGATAKNNSSITVLK